MEHLIRVVHACCASPGIREHEVMKLLRQARVANRKCDVSGMMLYLAGSFLLSLEGEAVMVDSVCGTIFKDKPRMRLTLIARESVVEREFGEWTMGFATVEAAEAGHLLGNERRFDTNTAIAQLDADSATTLLSIFGRRHYQSDRSGLYRAINHAGGAHSAVE